jgi:hypothetical protein
MIVVVIITYDDDNGNDDDNDDDGDDGDDDDNDDDDANQHTRRATEQMVCKRYLQRCAAPNISSSSSFTFCPPSMEAVNWPSKETESMRRS